MKKFFLNVLVAAMPFIMSAAGWPANYGGVMMQGFYWDSFKDSRWANMTSKADIYSQYFDLIWVPNAGKCSGSSSMGYDPVYWFNNLSAFGDEAQLREMIKAYNDRGTEMIMDVVINHKSGATGWVDFPNETWNGNNITWSLADICRNDECAAQGYNPTGANDTGDNFDGSRDLDHTSANVQKNVKIYLDYLLNDLGFSGFRLDMVKGYGATYTKMYNQSAKPKYSVGEYWDGNFNAVTGWIGGTGKESAAFDFPLKYVINSAFGNSNWSALSNKGIAGSPSWSQYAVTFVDNHDTFRNNDKLVNNVLPANAFILALPGTPCIFLPHFMAYQRPIGKMIKARKAAGITNQSSITEQGMQGGGYVIKVQGTVGTVMCVSGNATVSTTGFKLVQSGTNYAYYVSNNVPLDPSGGDDAKDISVYIKASAAPYVYAWNDNAEQISTAWPGNKLTKKAHTKDGTEWFTTKFNAVSFNMVINNGQSGEGNQTIDINGIGDHIFIHYDGTSKFSDVTRAYKGENPEGEGEDDPGETLPECAKWIDGKLFCYFEADATYTAPNAWIWNSSTNFTGGTWPGTRLTKVGKATSGNNVYVWEGPDIVESNMPTGVVFSTGTGSPQTADFTFFNGGYYNRDNIQGKITKPVKGDVNGDKVVDITDVNCCINVILGSEPASKYNGRADVNGDNTIDIADINAIINIILG